MELFYREQGEGTPLIILHGLFGSSDNWLTVTKSLVQNFKIYLVDQRNHGRSPHSEEFNYTVMSKDLLEFVENNGIQEVNIIGHSMGGKVAMKFAVDNPDKVKNLIIVDIAPKYYPPHHDNELRGLKSIDPQKMPNRQVADEILSKTLPDLGVRQFLLKNMMREGDQFKWRMNLDSIEKNIENIGEPLDPRKQFDKPTLFIRGGKSRYIKDEDFTLITEIFPNSKVTTIPSAGHWVQAAAPEEFLKIVNDFLEVNP